MRSLFSLSGRLTAVTALVLGAVLSGASLAVLAGQAAAASPPVVADGNAAYTPGTTSPPNQFDALTLVSGGAAAVNPQSLTIVTQPTSGTASAAPSSTNGIITYAPASGTTGAQTLTFAYCAPGDTYPSPGNCTTAAITYTPSTGQYFGGDVDNLAGVIQDLETAVTAPATVAPGQTANVTVAPVATTIPSSDDGISVESATQFSVVMPVPTGFTYVPGSISVAGGDATTSGKFVATYCTAPAAGTCTAQIDSGNYKTVYPYIETYLNTTVAGGANVTLPTVSAQFTATGSPGSVVPVLYTEFVLQTTVEDIGTLTFDGYPSCESCASGDNPTYAAPVAQATTTILSTSPTVTGVSPGSGTPAGGTNVTITGTNLAGATAVDFGSAAADITSDSGNSITASSPPGTGTVDVTVTTPDGTSLTSPADQFVYSLTTPAPVLTAVSPDTGPVEGGNSVTITGTNLENATSVDFGQAAGVITADSSTSVTATAPPGTGTVDITVTTPSGTTTPVPADQYSFGQQVTTELSSWTDTQACGIQSTATAPAIASLVTISTSGGVGGGGGGAASSDSGGFGGSASSVTGTFPVVGGSPLTAVTGCAGATAPNGSGVVSTGGAGGSGYSNGGGGGNGYYCAGIDIDGVCVGDGGADGSGGGGGGSSAVCVGSSCQVGVTPLAVAAGGGGGGESMCAGSDGGGGGTGGGGSSTSSIDLTGAGPSGTNGGMGATSGDVGGLGGVNNTGDSASGTPGGPGSNTVSAGDSAGNGGGGGGYVGGTGSTATAGVDCGAGGGGGAGSSWALNSSGTAFSTTSASASATLTFYGFVGATPSVTTNPASTTVDAGLPVNLSAAATGNPSPDVQWQVSTDGGPFTGILGATSPTYTFTASAGDNGNVYRAVFVNSIGSATTSPATLTVYTIPVVTQQPADATVLTGQDATFTAAASGNPAPTVRWEVSTDGGTTFNPIAGATDPTYTFATTSADNGDQYEAVFTNSVGPTASDPATLTLESVPVISAQPANVSVITGQTATFVAAATGLPAPTVQWEVSTNGGTTFTAIAGATSPTYSLTTALADNGHQYEADFTNPAGSTLTDPATLTVLPIPPLTITTASLPAGSVYQKSLGNTYSGTLAASGGHPPYKWSIASGSLPTGLKLSKSKGVISGKASFAGTFTFTAKVVDKKVDKTQSTATKVLSITIS